MATEELVSQGPVEPIRRHYGPHALQYGDLYVGHPSSTQRLVVVVHGGFWRRHRDLTMTVPLAEDLARRGWHSWNIEYRRVGQAAWSATLADCAAAIDFLAILGAEFSFDPMQVVILGHSAGGHLAAWAGGRVAVASRGQSPRPAVHVSGIVTLAGILDLTHAARTHVGDDAVVGFVGGGPEQMPRRFREADPMQRLPMGSPVRCVHSRSDERVPFEQSVRYVDAAQRAGDDAELIEVRGSHADLIDVRQPAWHAAVNALESLAPHGTGLPRTRGASRSRIGGHVGPSRRATGVTGSTPPRMESGS